MFHFVKTSHIAHESIEDITRAFRDHTPDIVAIELDYQRLHALQHQRRTHSPRLIFDIGLTGYLFLTIGNYLQNKLGENIGMQPGHDMLTAYQYARSQHIPITFIDQPINETMRRISQTPWKEKLKLAKELIKAFFTKPDIEIDLTQVPDEQLIHKIKDMFHTKFPHLYRVLILERNYVMANKLRQLRTTHPNADILVVLGAGHHEVEKLL